MRECKSRRRCCRLSACAVQWSVEQWPSVRGSRTAGAAEVRERARHDRRRRFHDGFVATHIAYPQTATRPAFQGVHSCCDADVATATTREQHRRRPAGAPPRRFADTGSRCGRQSMGSIWWRAEQAAANRLRRTARDPTAATRGQRLRRVGGEICQRPGGPFRAPPRTLRHGGTARVSRGDDAQPGRGE